MDCYFLAPDDMVALTARDQPGGPLVSGIFDGVETKEIMACPHLEQMVALTTGRVFPTCVAELAILWPPAGTPPPEDERSPWMTDPSIQRLPDRLRDALADVEPDALLAEQWAGELWGVEPGEALVFAKQIAALAKRGRDSARHLYWWMEL